MRKRVGDDPDLRDQVLSLIDEGWNSAEVAELLEIKQMSVAGYLAARTKGQYEGDEQHLKVEIAPEVRPALRLVK